MNENIIESIDKLRNDTETELEEKFNLLCTLLIILLKEMIK